MGIYCLHGTSRRHGRPVQRGRRAAAPAHPDADQGTGALGQRSGGAAPGLAAARVQAPEGAARGRAREGAGGGAAAPLYARRARARADPQVGQRIRGVLEPELRPARRVREATAAKGRKQMTAASSASTTADREIVVSRTIGAPRSLVFEAYTDVKHLAEWWGPDGFTT